jgi:hypothetical protein
MQVQTNINMDAKQPCYSRNHVSSMRTTLRRLLVCAVSVWPCAAWHHPVHQMITRAAILSLPAEIQERFGAEKTPLIQRYCVYPDMYPYQLAAQPELKRYCETSGGHIIHNVTWTIEDDLRALEYSLSGMIEGLRARDVAAAARHAGVLAHFLEDSTCPAHALVPFDGALSQAYPQADGREPVSLHAVIERSAPAVDLAGRAPQPAGHTVRVAASNLLGRVYRSIRQNREDLDGLVEAAERNDEAAMNRFRHKAAIAGAELVADAFTTAFALAGATAK